ncbi:MAG: hypothetical protein KDA96_24820, partial [Planctomycetaceae bacterium]|nr:hypothetical protein [Planctomycetaceae bacterium]
MNQNGFSLPRATQQKLSDFRRRVRQVKIAEGILAGVFGLALSYLAVFFLDRIIDTSSFVRLSILIVGCIGIGVLFPLKCHRWIWGTRGMAQVAILLKHTFPALGDQLLGVVELAQEEDGARSSGGSRTLVQAAINQVDNVVRDKDFAHAVPSPRHRHWAIAAGVPAGFMLLALAAVPAAGRNALVRWLMPWRDVDRYTFAQVDAMPDEIVVAHGEEFGLSAALSDSTRWKPAQGTARYEDQDASRASLAGGRYDFNVASQTESGTLNLRIGDLTKSISVNVAARPELSAMTARIQLPDYLQYSRTLNADVRGGSVSIVEGATVSLEAEVSRTLVQATINGEPVKVTGSAIAGPSLHVNESQVLDFQWKDELGLAARDPFRVKLNAVKDSEPRVSFRQQEPAQVILTSDVITFDVNADDDFGLRSVGLEWVGVRDREQPSDDDKGEKLVAPGSPETARANTTA